MSKTQSQKQNDSKAGKAESTAPKGAMYKLEVVQDGETYTAYLGQLHFRVQCQAMDQVASKEISEAGMTILRDALMPEHSDERFLDTDNYPQLNLKAVFAATQLLDLGEEGDFAVKKITR
jgi:hypothetical protein